MNYPDPINQLQNTCSHMALEIQAAFGIDVDRQALAIAEEVGEFIGAYRRASGKARRQGEWNEVYWELADVVITAYVMAAELKIDLNKYIDEKINIIYKRGWRN